MSVVSVEYMNFRPMYDYVDENEKYSKHFHKGYGSLVSAVPYVFEFASVDVIYEKGLFFKRKVVDKKTIYRKNYSNGNPTWKFLDNGSFALRTMNLDKKNPNDVDCLIELQQAKKVFLNEFWNKGEVI